MTITKLRFSPRAVRVLSRASLTCTAALVATAGVGMFGGATAHAEHGEYSIDTLGYTDREHTRQNGSRVNNIVDMNRLGQVVGNQFQFNGQVDPAGRTAWFFGADGLNRIGLFEGEFQSAHTSNSQVQISTVSHLNNLGYAAGVADRYDGGPTLTGQSAWRHFEGENQRVGLFTEDHNSSENGQVSTLVDLNALGDVVGNSERYDDDSGAGYSAYIQRVNDSEATRIGLDLTPPGPTGYNEHHRDGLQFANVTHLNDLGDAAGFSNRYVEDGLTQIGRSAWVRTATDGETRKVGFVDAEHTGATDGRKTSTVIALNNAGLSVGHSTRYNPSGSVNGQTAWRQQGAEGTIRLGFYDDKHTRGNVAASTTGEKNSVVLELNDGGYARGFSTRYDGGITSGQSAWMYSDGDSDDPERVGFVDADPNDEENSEHTGANGLQSSSALLLNRSGHVAGTSNRFTEENVAAGTSAWRQFKGGQAPVRLGFFDDTEGDGRIDHTRDDTLRRSSTPIAMNDMGDVIGHSTRYRTGKTADWGQTAWINDGETGENKRIGLTGFEFTRSPGSDDFQFSTVEFINDDGHAVGTSRRYNGNAQQAGQSGWYYDGGMQPIELTFDKDPSQLNRSFTDISFLSNDGIVLGYYEKYGEDAGNRAFLWDLNGDDVATAADERFHDLGELVQGGLSEEGWSALTSAIEMSELGHILGIGTLTEGGSMPFLMTPVPVPEPTGIALLAMTGLALLPRRRRR